MSERTLRYRERSRDPADWARELGISSEAVQLYLACEVIDLHADSFVWTRVIPGYDVAHRHRPRLPRSAFLNQVDLPRLREETGGNVFAPAREPVPGAEPIEEGKRFRLGALEIDSLLTWGHSQGGMTFVVRGLTRPIAIVGDSLFAGSMGGGNVSYNDALRNNLEKILTLPDETIICPGHGPMTTVGEEKEHNPFFAGKL